MKKHINRTVMVSMAVLLLLAACNKNAEENRVFILETPGYGFQKTALNPGTKGTEWEDGDQICINGTDANHRASVTVSGSSAVARTNADIPSDGAYFYACYPGSESTVEYEASTHTFTINLPTSRNAGELKAPFVGIGSKKNTDGDKVIRFTNTCALLKVSSVESGNIVITDAAGRLSGEFSVAYNGSSWNAISATPSNTAAANCTLTVINSGTADVYIPIPAGSHQLTLSNGDRQSKMGSAQLLEAGKIYSVNHWYVNLGLPSGTLWATCNIGASTPEEYGKYFCWGETAAHTEVMVGAGANAGVNYHPGNVKNVCSYAYYKWGKGDNQLGKYVSKKDYGMSPRDNKTVLDPEDDAAVVNWGGGWHMPTKEDFDELVANCSYKKKSNGYLLTSKVNSKTVFFPFSGVYDGSSLTGAGAMAFYFSSTLNADAPNQCHIFYLNYSDNTHAVMETGTRRAGHTIRPVRK